MRNLRRDTPRIVRALTSVGLLGAGLALVTHVAFAGVVKGKVSGANKLMNPVWNEAKEASSNRYTWREPSPTVRAEFRALFAHLPKEVCIAAIGQNPVTPGNAPIAFRIGGGRTTPVTLVVAPGTTIEVQNRDPFLHRPYAVGDGSFQASDMKGASNRQWKPGPGKHEIRDELAPSIRSWIVVEPNVTAVAFPNRDGSFQFGNLPPGEYTLKAYFDGEPVGKPLSVVVKNDAPMELREPLVLADEKGGEKK